MISLDTETTGVDFKHGARPFLVTTCDEEGQQLFWEWDVDPLTRKPLIPDKDFNEVIDLIRSADLVVMQNSKFDVKALISAIGEEELDWDWSKTEDTLLAGHLLASNHPHNLTDMAIEYLGRDIHPFEDRAKVIVEECRKIAKRDFPTWQIASREDKSNPSNRNPKTQLWKSDMWLPRSLAKELGLSEEHPWWTVTSEYANADSATTLLLWQAMEHEIERRSLWNIYRAKVKQPKIAMAMEDKGVTISRSHLVTKRAAYAQESKKAGETCVAIAKRKGFDLELPKGASPNGSLRRFCLGVLNLEPRFSKKSKTAEPSLDKDAMTYYQATLPPGDALDFVTTLIGKRLRDTALTFMESYEWFWLPTGTFNIKSEQLWYTLHPNFNQTGTDTLRWSSSNPNAQQISKQKGFTLRSLFGPALGREWWSMDGKNLELRIPAYESKQQELIELFERSSEPPFYGSQHLLNFSIVYEDIWNDAVAKVGLERAGDYCKTEYEASYYQWCKNGDFALQYNCGEKTADVAFHRLGAYRLLKSKFHKLESLNQWCISQARKLGYVETIPDRSVDPERGYPLLAGRSHDGEVIPTTPLCYRVSGTAMQWTNGAMVRCQDQLEEWNRAGWDGFMTLQVHDEIVFDFPKGKGLQPHLTNLPRAKKLKALMEVGGEYIDVPTPVSVEYHAEDWSKGLAI